LSLSETASAASSWQLHKTAARGKYENKSVCETRHRANCIKVGAIGGQTIQNFTFKSESFLELPFLGVKNECFKYKKLGVYF
jgi:hypothetical protein